MHLHAHELTLKVAFAFQLHLHAFALQLNLHFALQLLQLNLHFALQLHLLLLLALQLHLLSLLHPPLRRQPAAIELAQTECNVQAAHSAAGCIPPRAWCDTRPCCPYHAVALLRSSILAEHAAPQTFAGTRERAEA